MLLASFPGPSPLQRGGAWELGMRLVCYRIGTITLSTALSHSALLLPFFLHGHHPHYVILYCTASYKKQAGSEVRDMLRPTEI